MLRDSFSFPRLSDQDRLAPAVILGIPFSQTYKSVVGSPSTGAYIAFRYITNYGLGKMVKGHVSCVRAVKAYKGSRGTAVLILNLCTGWR
jgi:hypothetical protein